MKGLAIQDYMYKFCVMAGGAQVTTELLLEGTAHDASGQWRSQGWEWLGKSPTNHV